MNVTWTWVAGSLFSVLLFGAGVVQHNMETRVEAIEQDIQTLQEREAALRVTASVIEARYQDIIRRLDNIEALLERLNASRNVYPTAPRASQRPPPRDSQLGFADEGPR